jgi:hypothetical protein
MKEDNDWKDLDKYVLTNLKKEIWVNAIGTVVFLVLGIVFLIKGEVWWVPGVCFALSILGIYETIKYKKQYDDYKSS